MQKSAKLNFLQWKTKSVLLTCVKCFLVLHTYFFDANFYWLLYLLSKELTDSPLKCQIWLMWQSKMPAVGTGQSMGAKTMCKKLRTKLGKMKSFHTEDRSRDQCDAETSNFKSWLFQPHNGNFTKQTQCHQTWWRNQADSSFLTD